MLVIEIYSNKPVKYKYSSLGRHQYQSILTGLVSGCLSQSKTRNYFSTNNLTWSITYFDHRVFLSAFVYFAKKTKPAFMDTNMFP